ncbi:minor tail protein [Gordonia phage Biskit]|uniref:Minor tail protein n=1 Tax=Gordonia phage SketchMex TaxID=2250418 RepID=A0A345KQ24_9CAUD|nr:minor tail protein [Gordonia phage SketchMex]UVK62067.1 minor tail protein [Gordonia phage Biskit]
MAIASGSVIVADPAAPATKVVQPTSGAVFTSPGPGGPRGNDSSVPGPPNELSIGSVVSDTTPGVQISGESPHQVLSFRLPKGDKGDQGDPSTVPGPPGPANALGIGTVAEGSAAANITGSYPNQKLNLVLPKGPKGDVGPAGEVSEARLNAAISAALDQVIDGSPGALDTLNELAAALGDDPNFATTVSTQIATKADKIRQVIAGAGLTGGGTLEADRTLAVDFGTGTNQAVRGNDSRLSDARTPTSHQHNASDINAGTLAVARLGDGTITAAKLVQAVQDILTKANNATPVWKGTQAAYNAITTKDANTVYVIAG